MSTTINDIAKLLKSDDKKGDTSFWGIVHSTIEDGEGNVTGYNVSLDGSANGAVKCNKVVGAKQGDQVLVTLRANGEAVVVATKGGDTDVQDVVTDLEENYYTADEVDEKIAEVEGGSYQIIEWARSSSTSTAPTTGWSTTMPTLTTSYPYLWQRIVTVTGETRTAGTPQRAETMDGLYVFKNQAQTGSATVINGGAIDTSTLYIGRIGETGSSAENYVTINSSGMQIFNGGRSIAYFNGESLQVGNDSDLFSLVKIGTGMELSSYLNGLNMIKVDGALMVNVEGGNTGIFTNGQIICTDLSPTGNITCTGKIYGSDTRNLINNATSNQCHVGNSTDKLYFYGVPTITSTSGTNALRLDGSAVKQYSSSREIKENIKPLEIYTSEDFYKLKPSQFNYKDGNKDDVFAGFISEEIHDVCAGIASPNNEGKFGMWDEFQMISLMAKVIQEQHEEIEHLKSRVERLENK